jgi:hypothetical protein
MFFIFFFLRASFFRSQIHLSVFSIFFFNFIFRKNTFSLLATTFQTPDLALKPVTRAGNSTASHA